MHSSTITPQDGTKNSSKSAFDFIGNYYYYNSGPWHDQFLKTIIEKPINQLTTEELFFLIRDFDLSIKFVLPRKATGTEKEKSAQGTGLLDQSFFNHEEVYYQFIMLLRALGQRGSELVQAGQVWPSDARNLIMMITKSPHMPHTPAMIGFKTLLENSIQETTGSSLSISHKRKPI